MEHVARDEHHLRCQLDDLVERARERLRDVCLALVDSARSQPLVLAVAEVKIGEVNEAQKLSGHGIVGRRHGELKSQQCAMTSKKASRSIGFFKNAAGSSSGTKR